MKALFLTCGEHTPCSRFRVHQYLPRLRADGWEAVVRPCVPEAYTWPDGAGLAGKLRRLRTLFAKVHARKRDMRDAADFDLVYVERELVPWASPGLERRLARRNPNLVYDLDDAVWLKFGKRSPNPLAEVAQLAHAVIAGNEWLASWALKHNGNVSVVETPIDTGRWKPDPPRPPIPPEGTPPPIVAVWTGSSGNLPSLQLAAAALRKAREQFPRLALRIVANAPPAEDPLPPSQFVPWSPEAEVRAVASADLGLMPLPADEWSKGKCGFKLLQYMACALPAIASPVGVNADVLQGGCGLLAATAEEWEGALLRLLRDEGLRREMGANGRARAVARYSVEALYPLWKRALESALS